MSRRRERSKVALVGGLNLLLAVVLLASAGLTVYFGKQSCVTVLLVAFGAAFLISGVGILVRRKTDGFADQRGGSDGGSGLIGWGGDIDGDIDGGGDGDGDGGDGGGGD